jgi:prepilin-type N-terminal cleavage/methylation domain-containing protein
MKMSNKRGFSLVELVIVIVILAVISAIALPRISRGAKGADESALGQNLAILRSAIEMYAAEHGGKFPGGSPDGTNAAGTEEAFIAQLTKYSDKNGTVDDAKDAANGIIYGPYLLKVPPVTVGTNAGENSVNVVTGTTAPSVSGNTGWCYNSDTGQIIANSDADSDSGVAYDEW